MAARILHTPLITNKLRTIGDMQKLSELLDRCGCFFL
jgi:hypothetical protein